MKTWRVFAISLFCVSLLVGGLFGNRVLALTDELTSSVTLFTELIEVAHERYPEERSYRDLVYSSIHGMLRSLDPHTSFLSRESYDSMRERQQSSFYGLGIYVGQRNGRLTVITPIPGTASFTARVARQTRFSGFQPSSAPGVFKAGSV